MTVARNKSTDVDEKTDDDGIDRRAIDVGTEALAEEIVDPGPLDVKALAMAAAATAGLYAPGRDNEDDVLAKCLVRSVTEVVEKLSVSDDPENAGVGTTVEYVDAFFDEDGERVGTMSGNAVVLAMTPHMWQYHKSTTEFEDGTIEHTGVVDCTALMHRMTQLHRVVGTGGVYLGKSGYMAFEMSDPHQKPPHFSVTFVLC
ncbi:allene oxide cyclase barrel-like domain-containing protein [Streptomyces sp. NPDC001920]